MKPISKRVDHQVKKLTITIGKKTVVVTMRYDDNCKNGHNTFSITGDLYVNGILESCGSVRGEIREYFPELAKYLKWHLVSSEGPLHYISNTMYFVNELDLKNARRSAVWPDADYLDLTEESLLERLPELLNEFKKVMESLGFTY